MLLFGRPSLASLIAIGISLLVGMTVHEFAHVYVAYLAGDTTGADKGHLTLNPLVHINWVGFLMFVFIGFGILGSAPINPMRMRNPRWGYLAAVAAGPLSNLFLAIAIALPFKLAGMPEFFLAGSNLLPSVALVITMLVWWNVLLFFFNMLPLFPIDGWTIVHMLLPYPARKTWDEKRMLTRYILLGLIFLPFAIPFFPNILRLLIFAPAERIVQLLLS